MTISYSEKKQIADRYAQAAYALSESEVQSQAMAESLESLKHAFVNSADLRRIVANPTIEPQSLLNAFAALLERFQAPEHVRSLIRTVLHNKRGAILPLLADAFRARRDEALNIRRASITSAHALNENQLAAIREALGGADMTINLQMHIDSSLIGGLMVRVGSRQLDASVAGQLQRMKSQLKQKTV